LFPWQVEPLPRIPTPAAPKPAVPAERAERYESAPIPQEKTMPAKKDIDWTAVQNDRSDGMSVKDICKKYGVNNPTVYTKTKAPAGKARARLSKGPATTFKARTAAAKSNGTAPEVDLPAIIEALIARRDKIDRTIAALQEIA
jgi:transposase-like protein